MAASISFRPAERRDVPLLVGLTSGPGGGKTYSALRIASGIAGPGRPFAAVDTERRRMSHYADDFRFDVLDLEPPFTSGRMLEAIRGAQAAGYPAVVVDSMSHEWMGAGGVLEFHDAEQRRMAGPNANAARVEAMNFPAWRRPKEAHAELVEGLLQVGVPVVMCFRGKVNLKPGKDENGRKVLVEGPFRAVTSDGLPYELTVLLVLSNQRPGTVDLSQPNKISRPVRPLIRDGAELDEAFGAALAAWAKGGPAETAADGGKPRRGAAAVLEATRGRIEAVHDRAALDEILADSETARLVAVLKERSPEQSAAFDALVARRLGELEAGPS